jgi:hypothetical protein
VTRYVCIHGHFYQPPRENPWLDEIEPQPSAAPFPDWNARITAECYRPNAAARIVDGEGQIIEIVDNYARMSWNFGPTLLAYLARHAPDVLASLQAADRASLAATGHGAALAQAHGHLIMPLCAPRDRATQVRWGVADFRHRFGRDPVGMWLPECAVDVATLEALAAEGVAFTVLAPHQAARVRPPGGAWRDVDGADPGPGLPLPAAVGARDRSCSSTTGRWRARWRSSACWPTAAPSRGGWSRPAATTRRCATSPPTARPTATTTATATWALAWALESIAKGDHPGAALTNYGAYRAAHPATWEVADPRGHRRGAAPTASSAGAATAAATPAGGPAGTRPGVGRCATRSTGCAIASPTCSTPLGRELFLDPWAARDAYVEVLLTAPIAVQDRFLARHGRGPLAARSGPRPRAHGARAATPWRCTPAAAGSSTTSAASRPCRCCATRRGWPSWASCSAGTR